MQRLEVSGAVRPIYESLGVKRLMGRGLLFSVVKSNTEVSFYCGNLCKSVSYKKFRSKFTSRFLNVPPMSKSRNRFHVKVEARAITASSFENT